MNLAVDSAAVSKALKTRAAPRGESPSVVFWVDIFLLCVLALFTIAQIPRIMARVLCPEERRYRHLLYRSDLISNPPSSSSDTQSYGSHRQLVMSTSADEREKQNYLSVPRHIPAWSTVLRQVTAVLRIRFSGRIHLGGTLLLTLYFATLLFAALYRDSLFTNQVRPAYVAISQIPWVVALATKNNLISMLLGVGWDHLNYIHRFAGRLLVLAANVHVIGFIFKWTMAGSFTRHISQPRYIWGTVAIVCLDILFFFSLAIWRLRAYNVFFVSHVLAFVLFLVAVPLHMPESLSCILAGAGIYVLDLLLRCVKTRICTARIQTLPELCTTSVHIPALNAGWRAGQHVRLRLLSARIGYFGWMESHPFTIASASMGTTQQGLVLLCKQTGRWTRKLYNIASEDSKLDKCGVSVKVMVEGPYGGPGNTIISSFSGALLLAGGSGISYALSATEELLQRAIAGASSVTVLDLIWCVQHPESLTSLLPIFSSLLLESNATQIAFNVHVFYTRAETAGHTMKAFELPARLSLCPGHPNITCRLMDVVERTRIAALLPGCGDKHRGVFVGVCGPLKLGEIARSAIDSIDPEQYKMIGGVELHEEIYNL